MIDFPIIDTHLHLWDTGRLSYPWLTDIPQINRTFSLEDYNKACKGIEVEKMIFMQCECLPSQYREEVAWVSGLAEKDPRLEGIVAWAPLEKGEAARPEIEVLKANPLVKGLRRIIQYEADPEFCLRPDFIKGVNLLADYGLTFDICISHVQNKNVIRFIEQCPGVKMIIDHIGKPDIKNHILHPWKDEIKEMSEFDNVYCKLSSLATEADHKNWTIDDLRPYVEHLLECFGTGRLVFASDWPVSSLAADIPTCVSTIEELMEGASMDDLRKVFNQNGREFYGI